MSLTLKKRRAPLTVVTLPASEPVDVDAFLDTYARVLLAQAQQAQVQRAA
jgi:hypothetical protein